VSSRIRISLFLPFFFFLIAEISGTAFGDPPDPDVSPFLPPPFPFPLSTPRHPPATARGGVLFFHSPFSPGESERRGVVDGKLPPPFFFSPSLRLKRHVFLFSLKEGKE